MSLSDPKIWKVFGLSKSSILYFCYEREKCNSNTGWPLLLSPLQEVVFLLLYLRYAFVDIFLASLFQISHATSQRTRIRMVDFFYSLLKSRLTLHTLDWRLEHSVQMFHRKYTFILDGFELAVVSFADRWDNGKF